MLLNLEVYKLNLEVYKLNLEVYKLNLEVYKCFKKPLIERSDWSETLKCGIMISILHFFLAKCFC